MAVGHHRYTEIIEVKNVTVIMKHPAQELFFRGVAGGKDISGRSAAVPVTDTGTHSTLDGALGRAEPLPLHHSIPVLPFGPGQ